MSKTFSSIAAIGSAAIIAGGCQLINPQPPKGKPSPTPATTSAPASFPSFLDVTTPSASTSPLASPSASPKVTTKGGIPVATTPKKVLGTTTPKVTTTTVTNPLYDTSFDSLEVTNFPGQELEKELILYNKSDKQIMFSARAAEAATENNPVRVNGSYEATGNIPAAGSTTVKIKVMSKDQNPSFSTTVTINFISQSNQILAVKTLKVIAHTPVADTIYVDSNSDSEAWGNKTADITYRTNYAYPIKIVNHHSNLVKWSADIKTGSAQGKLVLSATSGDIAANGFWLTDLHFTSASASDLTQVLIEFTFKDSDNHVLDTKTLTLNIKK